MSKGTRSQFAKSAKASVVTMPGLNACLYNAHEYTYESLIWFHENGFHSLDRLLELVLLDNPSNCRELTSRLLAYGADVNARGSHGATALLHALGNNGASVIELLLNCPGIDLAATDASGQGVLHYAAGNRLCDAVRLVLDHPRPEAKSLVLDSRDSQGATPMHVALLVRHNLSAARSLLSRGHSARVLDEALQPPLPDSHWWPLVQRLALLAERHPGSRLPYPDQTFLDANPPFVKHMTRCQLVLRRMKLHILPQRRLTLFDVLAARGPLLAACANDEALLGDVARAARKHDRFAFYAYLLPMWAKLKAESRLQRLRRPARLVLAENLGKDYQLPGGGSVKLALPHVVVDKILDHFELAHLTLLASYATGS